MQKGILLLFVLAASAVCQQQSVKGCFYYDTDQKACTDCYRRHGTASGLCGPLLPVTDICLIYNPHSGQKHCVLCRPGYGLTAEGGCIVKDVFNCVDLEQIVNKYRCLTCGSGQYPNTVTGQCVPVPKAKDNAPNCLWGQNQSGGFACTRGAPPGTLSTCSPRSVFLRLVPWWAAGRQSPTGRPVGPVTPLLGTPCRRMEPESLSRRNKI